MDFKMNAVIHRGEETIMKIHCALSRTREWNTLSRNCAFDVETYAYFYTTFKNEAAQ